MSAQTFQNFARTIHTRSTPALLLLAALVFYSALTSAQSEPVLNIEFIDQRLNALQNTGAGEGDEAVTAYEEARGFLRAADSFNGDAATYADAMTSAPLRQAETQARIDAFEDEFESTADSEQLPAAELKTLLVTRRAELGERTEKLSRLDRRLASREANVEEIRRRLGEIDTRVDALPVDTAQLSLGTEPSQAEAERCRNAAELLALGAERRALRAQLNSQPARYSAMATERAEAAMLVGHLTQQVRQLEQQLREQVLEITETQSLDIDANSPVYALANGLLEREVAVREEQVALNEKLAIVQNLTDNIKRSSSELKERSSTARRLVDFGGGSDGLGAVLTLYWNEIDSFRLPFSTASFTHEAGATVVDRIEHEEALKALVSTTAYINGELAKAGINTDSVPEADQGVLSALASSYRDRLRSTINAQSDYIEALRVLGDGHDELRRQTGEYKQYLESLILWIPDRPPLWKVDKASISMEIAALWAAFQDSHLSIKPALLFGLLAFALLRFYKSRLKTYQLGLNTLIRRPRTDATRYTVFALCCIALRALPVPLLMVSIATLFSNESVAWVLHNTGIALFVCLSVKLVCEPEGVGIVHFDWPEALVERLHREFGWLIRIVLPLAGIALIILGETVNTGDTVLGRVGIILVLALPLLLIFNYLVTHARTYGSAWLKVRALQVRLALGIVLSMLIAAIALGHSYSTQVIFESLADTVMVALCLILVHAVLSRWLLVTRRRLRLAELMSARTERETADEAILDEREASLVDVSAETRELINMGTFVTGFFALLYIWAPLLPALDAMAQVNLWTSSSTVDGQLIESHFTLAALITVIALITATIYAAGKLPALIELILRARTSVSPSSRYTVIALLNYVIIGAGITAALSALGLEWSQLQWLVAALGVGIGFGLQEIIANFISGLIILFERPIRVGDIISTGGNDGVVTRIRIRATSIRDWDGKELLVPNKEFITGRLLNWTLSDVKVRLVIPIGIAYGSDVELAIRTMESVVSSHSRVVEDPPLQIIFEGFGDDALLLSARFYLDSVENRMGAMTEVNQAIYRAFNEAGIVIAFPQRDIHFDAEKPIRIALENGAD